jgi:hypothetical protein
VDNGAGRSLRARGVGNQSTSVNSVAFLTKIVNTLVLASMSTVSQRSGIQGGLVKYETCAGKHHQVSRVLDASQRGPGGAKSNPRSWGFLKRDGWVPTMCKMNRSKEEEKDSATGG